MTKELVISANRHETKVAILEDDQLVEIYFQRANEYSLAGSIHKGRVTRVLPGMQSAFVDLGLERDTFLYVSDFFEEHEEYDRLPADERYSRGERGDRGERSERVERSERGERGERANRAPAEAAALENPVLPGREEPLVTAAGAAPAVAPEPSSPNGPGEESEARDRRTGRRGRRRRGRGHGFPESKYASDLAAEPRARGVISEESSEQEQFAVLPGESLAKYRHPPQEESSSVGKGELLEQQPAREEPPQDNSIQPEAEMAVDILPEVPLPAPEEAWEDSNEADSDTEIEPADTSDLSAEAEAASEIVAEEREGGAFDPEDVADTPVPGLELIASESRTSGILITGEELVEDVELEPAEAVPEAAGAEPGPNVETGTSERPLSAQVREQSGRYLHRGSRRMRRRMRGGPVPAGGERSQAAEPAPEGQVQTQHSAGRPERERAVSHLITDLLKEGQEILVQVAKEPLGQKGARITSHIALPGRYVVYMPTLEHMGVSRKVASDEERMRLRRILQTHRAGLSGGFIVRTAGEGRSEEEIAADMKYLYNLWQDIRRKAEKKPAPLLLHHDLDIVQRTLRDQVTDGFKAIWIDNEEIYESVLRFAQRFQPALVSRVKLYTRNTPIFDAFGITGELEKALRPKVWLKSGGYIVINQTEALVAIDVNTGKYVGKSNRLEDTIVKTNTEAVKEIVRQIRLRDLGGIIVVDFIDMDERKNRQKVMQTLEEAMRADKAPYKILQFNDFGLVAITRKRVKQSLERALCSPCPYCEGSGSVKSVQTIVGEILVEAQKLARAVEGKDVILRVHPEVAKFLKSNQNRYLEELEEVLRRPVLVKSDPQLHHEKFDLA